LALQRDKARVFIDTKVALRTRISLRHKGNIHFA
jgi:hypothetical protein